jgi:hypothetical protein
MLFGDAIALKCCETVPMRRQGNVQRNTKSVRAWAYHEKGEDTKVLPDAEKAVALAPKDANRPSRR